MKIDLSKHKEAYLNEARALIKAMNIALVELEKAPEDNQLLHQIFRSVHTLKSLAATMNYQQSMELCHVMEDLLDAIKNNKISIENCADLLFACFDMLSANLNKVEANEPEESTNLLISELKAKLSGNRVLSAIKKVAPNTPDVEKIKAIEVKVERLDTLLNLAEELLVLEMKLDSIAEQLEFPELTNAVEGLSRLISELQYHVIQARLVPIGYIFNRFPRMVRDLAKQQQKKIKLIIEGEDIELDRVLIDEIGESIIHLVRNAIDHGLETPAERIQQGKPEEGVLALRAFRSKESALIEISDDGRGIDVKAIKELAIKHKMLDRNATEQEVIDVLFSGLSTNKLVTSISGRGLGLGIVKQKIESIGGTVKVKFTPNKGTTFLIEIPLTLAIIKTLFVKVGVETYAIPIDSVDRLLIVAAEEIKGLMEHQAIIFEDNDIPLIKLADLFGVKSFQAERQPIVVIHKGEERIGLVVDSLLTTQEVIIKPLSSTAKESKYFSGAALIGSGAMVLILDTGALTLSSRQLHHA